MTGELALGVVIMVLAVVAAAVDVCSARIG